MLARLIPTLVATSIALPPAALAEDNDGDGVLDVADAFPCDAQLAAIQFAPAEDRWFTLAFEDQWPAESDLDFNDVVVRVHYRLYTDGLGRLRRLRAVFEVLALGGDLSNGLALQLPLPRAGVSARLRHGSGAWQPLDLQPDAVVTVILADNLRALFGHVEGPINSRTPEPQFTAQELELELELATPAVIDAASAPFDVFIFRAGDFGHQIHLPAYPGTQAMRTALFGVGSDASAPGRTFIHTSGTPFALNLQDTSRYPLEGVSIDRLFPDIVGFAASAGATHTAFYLSPIVAEHGCQAPQSTPPQEPEPDRACDATPDDFVIPDLFQQSPSTVVTSASVTLIGFDGSIAVAVSGQGAPELSVNGGPFASTAQINPGQTLMLRMTTAASPGTPHTATLTAGRATATWRTTTAAGLQLNMWETHVPGLGMTTCDFMVPTRTPFTGVGFSVVLRGTCVLDVTCPRGLTENSHPDGAGSYFNFDDFGGVHMVPCPPGD